MSIFKNNFIVFTYFFSTIALFIASQLIDPAQTIDIVSDDAYIIITQKHILLLITSIFLIFTLISLLFHIFKHPLLKSLFWIHILLTFIGLFSLRYVMLTTITPDITSDYSVMENLDEATIQNDNSKILILTIGKIILIAQTLFVLNMLISIFRKKKTTSVS